MRRSDQERPEQAYRRGVQQGAYFILEALEANRGRVDHKLLANIRRYVGHTLFRWRYGSRRLRRHIRLDDPPRMKPPPHIAVRRAFAKPLPLGGDFD
jgi:hypothetical protein